MARLDRWAGGAVALMALAGTAFAQEGVEDPDPRVRQAALHAALIEKPDDPALMIAYARASAEARDYEAVIATLERALIYDPGDAAVLVELGTAYFRLGSYAAARQYFQSAKEAGVPPDVEAVLDRYLAAIDERAARSKIEGSVAVGLAASSNANLGVDDRSILFFGMPALIDEGFEEKSDTGFRVLGEVTHSYDLGTPRLDFWRTDGQLYALNFFDEDAGDVASLAFTTGPSLSLDESAYGAKARPFVGARVVRSAGDPYYVEYGAGATLSESLTSEWSYFARGDVGYRDYASDYDDFDAAVFRGLAGGAYTFGTGRTAFAALVLETDRAEEHFNTNVEYGLRLGAGYDYDPGLELLQGVSTFSVYAEVMGASYGEPNPTVDPDETREDLEMAVGLSHLMRIRNGFGVQVDLDAFRRNSNIENYDVDAVTGVISVVYEF